jgi:hypothetical protein
MWMAPRRRWTVVLWLILAGCSRTSPRAPLVDSRSRLNFPRDEPTGRRAGCLSAATPASASACEYEGHRNLQGVV